MQGRPNTCTCKKVDETKNQYYIIYVKSRFRPLFFFFLSPHMHDTADMVVGQKKLQTLNIILKVIYIKKESTLFARKYNERYI